jgi:hypothetical protein
VNAAAKVREPSDEEIRFELEQLLSSSVFRGSKRCHDFTYYVCTQALAGAAGTLKEQTIAVEVFGRKASGNLGDDTIVRVGAREVRRRLALYYSGEGAHNAVRIELPTGSYVPVFRYQTETSPVASVPVVTRGKPSEPVATLAGRAKAWRGHRRTWWVVAGAAVALAFLVPLWRLSRSSASQFETFWRPAFDRPSPVLLVMAHPIVYQPSSRALLLDEQRNGKSPLPVQRAVNIPAQLLNGSDYVPVFNQFIGLGDGICALRLSTLLAQHSRATHLRLADKVEFNDLYGSSVILIGGSFTNRWTAELTKNLRFRFGFEAQSKPSIVDTLSKKTWALSAITDDRRAAEDYILICRLPHAQTGAFMMVAAGLAGYGTEAAGRIVSDPTLLEPILRKLPEGWAGHNLEMVLHVEVVSEAPALPEVAAAYTW